MDCIASASRVCSQITHSRARARVRARVCSAACGGCLLVQRSIARVRASARPFAHSAVRSDCPVRSQSGPFGRGFLDKFGIDGNSIRRAFGRIGQPVARVTYRRYYRV